MLYHILAGWPHQTSRGRHRPRSLMSETLQIQMMFVLKYLFFILLAVCVCVCAFGAGTWVWSGLNAGVQQTFLTLVDEWADDNYDDIHHIQTQIPWKRKSERGKERSSRLLHNTVSFYSHIFINSTYHVGTWINQRIYNSACVWVWERVPSVSPRVVVFLNNMRKVQNTATM